MATEAMGFIDSDPIAPTSIEHNVDEVIIEGEIEQSYNYLDYWFEGQRGRVRARTYLDAPWSVSVYPPIQQGVSGTAILVCDYDAEQTVLQYLSRRFSIVKVLGDGGYSPVWMAMETPRLAKQLGLDLADL